MGSESKHKLPFIDFSKIEKMIPGSDSWNSTRIQVTEALQEHGCFEAYFTGVPLEVRKSLFNSMEQLFDLPVEIKAKNVGDRPGSCYVGPNPRGPLYESLAITDSIQPENTDNFTYLMWPQGNPEFSNTIQMYSKKFLELGEIVRRMVLESLGLEKYLEEHLGSTSDLLRFTKYRVPEPNQPKAGLMAHKDTVLLTVIHQNLPGLEVQIKGGEEWIQVDEASPYSFIVMAGDCFEAYSNGRIHAPFHRVTMVEDKARFSILCFTNMKADYTLETPEEMVDEEHPLLYKPFNNEDFLHYYMKLNTIEERRSARKAYCGT